MPFRSRPLLGWFKHFVRLLFQWGFFWILFQNFFKGEKRVKLSIACHFVHLAYIIKKDAKEILICTSLNIAVILKLNACICRALTVL